MSETASADAYAASDDRVLLEAQFNPNVKTYWLLSGVIILLVCVVTIPLIPVWWILGMAFTDRYLSSLSCVLTERNLKVSKGVFVRQEKTVPLEKITDLGLVQGPIMRHLELEALSVETAGGTTAGALVQMVGIVDTRDFRAAVLRQRDRLASLVEGRSGAAPTDSSAPAAPTDMTALLEAVNRLGAHVERIEGQTERIAAALEQRGEG
ncbi:MAG: PH domain-containing protein [Planctomycetota bacterium]|jgi:putative membrane protein